MDHGSRQNFSSARRIVVKVGSGVLVGETQELDGTRIGALVESLGRLLERGQQIVLVTSGAVAAGAPAMGLVGSAKTIPQKQACAAVGQNLLMALYEQLFSRLGHHTAQILLTQDDFRNRERYLNARNTLETLLSTKILPIVNENDTVVVKEIKFGAALVQADLLLFLSTVDGFYEHRSSGPSESLKIIPAVPRIDDVHFGYAQVSENAPGVTTGGMRSKLIAIEKAAQYGIPSVLVIGLKPGVVDRILDGEDEGTLFLPLEERLSARKHWILHTLAPQGNLTVDAGAMKALLEQGRSLLSIGITSVDGDFRSGNAVCVLGPEGNEIARGLSYYSSAEVETIRGCKSDEIESLLGYIYYDEVIHRDNLALISHRQS